ncbi:MAG: Phosphinothricin N-acetyltransferase [Steroidobacteraceae bacterium]|nr:Phosphinothricin N-acetyltransferase [Steroidobacteraceae bacterium]
MPVRACTLADMPAVQAIYAQHVLHGTASFELEPPSPAEMAERFRHIAIDGHYPFLVAEDGARVVGFAYASEFRARPAYRFTCENSVYIAPHAQRRGIGSALMRAVITQCGALGLVEMLAVIGDAENHGSIGLHRSLGFVHVGTFRRVGYKFGRWLDVVLMQRTLRSGEA